MRVAAIVVSVIILIVIGLLLAPNFIDLNQYKGEIVKQVQTQTGLEVDLSGPISLSLLPAPQASLEAVQVRNPEDQGGILLQLDKAKVNIALFPLLQKNIQVTNIELVKPVVNIVKMQDGSFNFDTQKIKELRSKPEESATENTNAKPKTALSFDKIEITDGALTYSDQSGAGETRIADLNTVIKMDSLNGPFNGAGKAVINAIPLTFDLRTKSAFNANKALELMAELGLQDRAAGISFSGVIDPKMQDAQGQLKINSENLKQDLDIVGIVLPDNLAVPLTLQTLLSANTDKITMDDVIFDFAGMNFFGKGAVQMPDGEAPLNLVMDMQSKNAVEIDRLLPAQNNGGDRENERSANLQAGNFLPETLTLPPVNLDINFAAPVVKYDGKEYGGVNLTLRKSGKDIALNNNIKNGPGGLTVNAMASVDLGASSTSKTSKNITYSNPSLAVKVKGGLQSIADFARAYDIDLSKTESAVNKAQFDIDARLKGATLNVKPSRLDLDGNPVAFSGTFTRKPNGRDMVALDVSAKNLDFDRFIPPAKNAQQKSAGKSMSPADAVKDFSLPVDLDLDISLQNATYNGQPLKGVRADFAIIGNSFTINQAGINNFDSNALSVKGAIANIQKLTGIDMDFAIDAKNIPALIKLANVDPKKIPAGLNSFSTATSVKGSLDLVDFVSNVKALGGSVEAKGAVRNPADNPMVNNLSLRVKHPDFVKAVQIVNPEFKGGSGLNQPIDLYAAVNQSGKVYNLSNIDGSFGPMPVNGSLNLDMSTMVPSVTGALALGTVPLEKFLGDGKTSAKGSAGAGSAGKGERWSKAPIDASGMKNLNLNLNLSAKAVNHGGWSFTNPKTKVTLSGGTLKIDNLNAGLFGGQVALTTTVKALDEGGISSAMATSMDGVSLEALSYALSGANKLQSKGSVNFKGDIDMAGQSVFALVNAMNGAASLNGRDIVIEGFGLARIAGNIIGALNGGAGLNSILGGTSGGQTVFEKIDGDYKIQNGVVQITSMAMTGPEGSITSVGSANLPGWVLDTVHMIDLHKIDEIKPFDVKLYGPIDRPQSNFQEILSGLWKSELQGKVQNKLNDLIGDKVDDNVGKALQQFGILPTAQERVSEPQAPVETTPEDSSPSTQQQTETAPAAPKRSIEEEAIRGVLDGLLR